jgi:Gpi18-like mannosyltransferase
MFTGIVYTEGLYLCLSTAALRAFDQKSYLWTAFWGAMATATRPTGMALIPAFILAAVKERRPVVAYISGLTTSAGLISFSVFCGLVFNHPLAFISAQKGWRPTFGFDWQGWLNMLLEIPLGYNWYYGWVVDAHGGLKDPAQPVVFSIVVIIFYCLWLSRKNLSNWIFYGAYSLLVLLLIFSNELLIYNLLNILMFFGGGWLLWHLRKQLTSVTIFYGFCGISLLLASGSPMSLSRLAYGVIPLSVCVGLWLSRYPQQGYLAMGLFLTLLAKMSVGFAQRLWVG